MSHWRSVGTVSTTWSIRPGFGFSPGLCSSEKSYSWVVSTSRDLIPAYQFWDSKISSWLPQDIPCSPFVKTFVVLHVEHLKYGVNPSRSQLGKERQGQRRASFSVLHSSAGCLKALGQRSKEELPWSSSEIVLSTAGHCLQLPFPTPLPLSKHDGSLRMD